jgi:hypothetical protein
MSTVSMLLSLVDSLYPNATSVEDKVRFMNIAQNELSPYFGFIAEDSTLKTVTDQDSYDLPEGIPDISYITSLAIGKSDTPTGRYDYRGYKLNKANDMPMSYEGYYQIYDSSGNRKLAIYPIPTEDDLPIVIRYRKQLTKLSAGNLNFTPEFDNRYHEMLAFYCCHMICSVGSSPDYYQADMFMAKYDSALAELWKTQMQENNGRKLKRRDNKQWHKRRSYSSGD